MTSLEATPLSPPAQIRYDSFSAPLLLLGCFSKDSTSFPEVPPTLESHDQDSALDISGSFSNFESEFKTCRQPTENLDPNSFVFCAAEIFRFLRDMALDLPGIHSTPLLEAGDVGKGAGIQNREKNFYGAPPSTSRKSVQTQHLIHPGAVLCMMDLLPAFTVTEDLLRPQSSYSGHGMSPPSNGRGMSPLVDLVFKHETRSPSPQNPSPQNLSPRSTSPQSPSPYKSEDSFYDATEEVGIGVEGEGKGEGFGTEEEKGEEISVEGEEQEEELVEATGIDDVEELSIDEMKQVSQMGELRMSGGCGCGCGVCIYMYVCTH